MKLLDFILHSEKCVFCKGWYDKRSMKPVADYQKYCSGHICLFCQKQIEEIKK